MTRRELRPAMAASLLLHLTIATALLISWNFGHNLKVGAVVPVTLVANAPETNLREAEQAPVEQTAATPEPQPTAPAQSAPPPEPPKPLPPPKPAPTPKVEPKPTPAPAKPAPPKPEKSLDLDALSASISKLAKPTPAKPSSAAKGPARPETALQARPSLGNGAAAAAAISGLADELQRRWNPNCDVEGGRDVQLRAFFTINPDGSVARKLGSDKYDITVEVRSARNAVADAAANRAASAIGAAAPYRNLPREFYGERISVNFNAREACA